MAHLSSSGPLGVLGRLGMDATLVHGWMPSLPVAGLLRNAEASENGDKMPVVTTVEVRERAPRPWPPPSLTTLPPRWRP